MGAYQRIKKWAEDIVTWASLFALLAAAFAWLSSMLTPMKGYGLADFIFVGILMALASDV